MEFKDRISEFRKIRGMTQTELAKEIGVTTRSVQHYESGARLPRKETITRIAKVLGVSRNALYSDSEYSDPDTYKNRVINEKNAEKLIRDAGSFFSRKDISDEEKKRVFKEIQKAADTIC